MIDQFISLAQKQFGPTGGNIVLVLALVVFVAGSFPAFLNVMKVLNPSHRNKKRTLEQLDIALKLTELHNAQKEANVEFVNVSETWDNLIVDDKIKSSLGESSLVKKLHWEVATSDATIDGNAPGEPPSVPALSKDTSKLLAIDPSNLSWIQKVLIAAPSLLILLPISAFALLVIGSDSIDDGASTLSGFEIYLAIVFLVSPFAAPFIAIDDTDFALLESNRSIFLYWYKAAMGSILSYAGAVIAYGFLGALIKAIFWS